MIFLHMYTAAAEAETQVTFADDVKIIQGSLALEMRHKLASEGLFLREISVLQCCYHWNQYFQCAQTGSLSFR